MVLIGAAAISAAIFFSVRQGETPEFVVARRGDLKEEVSATGRIKPASSVNLAFDKSGRVWRVLVEVGNEVLAGAVLVRLESGELLAQLAEAEANVKAQAAKLEEIKRGTRAEEIAVQAAKVSDAQKTLAVRIQDAYTKSDDAIHNKVDQFFSNPRSGSPVINLSVFSSLKSDLESLRVGMESRLSSWKISLAGLESASDLHSPAALAKANLELVRSFLDKAALVVNEVTSSSNLSQTTLDGYRTDVYTARNNIETAILNLTSADSNLSIQEKELALKEASPLPEKIAAQEAAWEEALAKAENIRAQLAKNSLRSPLAGTVTAVDIKAGEIIAANTGVVSVISRATLQIEVNIPEADVAKIKVGQTAAVTLDAYGSEIVFEAKVVSLDPAETMVEGVATYKTTLQFAQKDERIKSGMTANIDIVSARREGVIVVPQRAVASQNGNKKIKVLLENGTVEERTVTTGLRGSDGNVEIIEGVSEGEKVVVSR